MNVVAGLAGAYLLRDSFDTGTNPLLPGPVGVYELPLVVQDRQFNADGSLLYPVAPSGPNGTNGPWIGEYFGDAMLVNGKVWPTLTLEPAVYRFHVLNGCNARILTLRIAGKNDQLCQVVRALDVFEPERLPGEGDRPVLALTSADRPGSFGARGPGRPKTS